MQLQHVPHIQKCKLVILTINKIQVHLYKQCDQTFSESAILRSQKMKKSYEKKTRMPCHSVLLHYKYPIGLQKLSRKALFSFSWHRRPLLRQTLDIVLSASSVIFLSFNARPAFETSITVGEICIWRCMHIKIMYTIMYAC